MQNLAYYCAEEIIDALIFNDALTPFMMSYTEDSLLALNNFCSFKEILCEEVFLKYNYIE